MPFSNTAPLPASKTRSALRLPACRRRRAPARQETRANAKCLGAKARVEARRLDLARLDRRRRRDGARLRERLDLLARQQADRLALRRHLVSSKTGSTPPYQRIPAPRKAVFGEPQSRDPLQRLLGEEAAAAVAARKEQRDGGEFHWRPRSSRGRPIARTGSSGMFEA